MLTPRAGAVRDWLLFALAALAPAVAVGLLGVRALRNEEAGARREIALGLDASAERVASAARTAISASRTALSEARLEGDTTAIASVLRSIAPPFARPVILGSDRSLLEPAAPGASTARAAAPSRCSDLARAVSSSTGTEARRDLLDQCEEARSPTGRWVWPIVALNPPAADRSDEIALWFEAHAALLGAAEREARSRDVAAAMDLPALVRERITRSLTTTAAGRDDLVAALRADAAAAALRGELDAAGLLAWDGESIGALRPLADGRLAGFLIDRATLTAALDAGWGPLATGQRASFTTGHDRTLPLSPAHATADPGLFAIAAIGEDLAIAIEPADARAVSALAARSRALLAGIALGSLALAFAVAGALFARMRAAKRASALRTDFVGAVSHELRTPIASVRMLAELLDEGRVEQGEHAEVYAALAREARRLGETVDRLLGFSRMAAGHYKLTPAVDRVATAVAASIDTFEERSPGALPVTRDLDETASAPIDKGEIRLAVDNLLANAKKYAPSGAPYRVRVAREEGGVVIQVGDRGPGIAARDQRRIFEPFERVDDRLSRATEGSGIGLSLVRHVARAHGGRVRVDSEPGKGALFTIWIPEEARST